MGLLTLCAGATLGCGITMSELHERNPAASTLQVPCHPFQVLEHVKLFAMRGSSGHIVTDETQGALRDFAGDASVFIEVNKSAPRENAETMASDYGLVCREYLPTRSTPLEALREEKPCSAQATTTGDSKFMGDTNKPPCNAGAANSQTAALPRIAVCARPPGIAGDTWYGGPGIKADVKTQAERDAQVAKATVEFYLDTSAPPESIWHFGPDIKVRCAGKAPMPYALWLAKNSGAGTQQAGSGSSGTAPAAAPTSTAPKAGSGPPSVTSSPNGQGPALSTFEQIANNTIVGGALAQGNTSAPLNQANGHRNGMPGGKNVGGFSFPLLQMGVGAFMVLSAVGVQPKKFIDFIVQASKKGQRVVIEKADQAALSLADDLIQQHGQYEMAKGLEEMQTVMPYAMGEKFTQGLGNKFQAHKIFEKQALEKFKDLTGRTDIEKLPSVILTEAEHKKITNALAKAWKAYGPKKGEKATVEQLRAIYNHAYKLDYPHWLEIIEKQLR